MEKKEIKHFAVQLMDTADAVYLTTVDKDGVPYIRALENLKNSELFPKQSKIIKGYKNDLVAYLSTNTSSAKVEQIKKNPRVAAYYCRPREFLGVMLGGFVEIVTDQKIKKELWGEGWERYYPKGVGDPDYTILRLRPTHLRGWNQNTTFLVDLD
ncbi:MAG: pyridoxamine 5'-phosphate oxidase family protein [Promethearchaeota archaeon]